MGKTKTVKTPAVSATITTKGPIFDGMGPEIVARNISAAMWESVAMLEAETKIRTPRGVGGASIRAGTGGRGVGLINMVAGEVEIGQEFIIGTVGHSSPYGQVVEEGRTPGKKMPPGTTSNPPDFGILDWIMLKITGGDEQEALDIEWAVRRNIARFGTEGAHMFRDAFAENEALVHRIFDEKGLNISRELEG